MVMLLPPFHSLALPTAAHGEPSNMLGQRGSLNKKKKKICALLFHRLPKRIKRVCLLRQGEGNNLLWLPWGLC